jgi:Fe-S-cluster containining protein
MAVKEVTFAIETPDGRAPAITANLPGDAVPLSSLVPLMHQIANQIVTLAIGKAAKKGDTVTCGPGCGVCCCQLVPVSAPEIFYMVENILQMPVSKRFPVLKRFEQIEARINESDIGLLMRNMDNPQIDNNAVAARYFYLGESCPFLESGSCSIHAWRPVVCREFNAVSTPELCADPFKNKIRTVPLFKRPSKVLALLASRICDLPVGLVPMPLMFDWFEANKAAAKKTWPAKFLVSKLLEITTESRGR